MNADCSPRFIRESPRCIKWAENVKGSPVSVIKAPGLGLAAALDWTIVGTLALLVVLGFGLRVTISALEPDFMHTPEVRAYVVQLVTILELVS